MKVGICTFNIMMYEGSSLKEKRMIVKSVIERIKSRYNVSIAEIADQDKWRLATIGFCCISNNKRHVEKTIQEVLRFLEKDGRGELINIDMEVI
ncbi:DUF503 domain-containing protein [Tindallia californiensis]|uniref:DUF503 domain-containing protein n=1 Tax=Tindallia californiensis TaxID=159292 RepID=A0A1H3IB68_9FIRM|nr:DUF503 domain-containing protein [Tindallia californiensis]SDY24675.1 hypothetical protein SAMN05192546_10179 [Tindallia californiensis]